MDDVFRDGKPVRASVPTAPGRSRSRSDKGRVCSHPGCETVLSTYNVSTTCWAHQDAVSGERRTQHARPGLVPVPLQVGQNIVVFPVG
jgi:hypothetical protein